MMRTRTAAVLAGAAALLCAMTPTFAGASAPDPNSLVAVAGSLNVAAVPGILPFGATPDATPETVSFILRGQNMNVLADKVTKGMDKFLTVSQFADQYGSSPDSIKDLQHYLTGFGITSQVYPDRLVVVASGTAGQFNAALVTKENTYWVPGFNGTARQAGVKGQLVHGNVAPPELPYRLAVNVQAILGLTNYSPMTTNLARSSTVVAKYAKPNGLATSDCVALTGISSDCHLPSDFAAQYGLTSVANRSNGAGQTIGIVTLAALDPGAPQYFWSNIANVPDTGRTVTVTNVDGGPGAPSGASGSDETDLDVEQSGALAPGANVVVYQAPNTDYGFVDAFFTAASQNVASSVSASWGQSETVVAASVAAGFESPNYLAAFDEAYLELAAQGQSAFVSAGDSGAFDASRDLQTTNLAVDTPSSSPYVTAAGGTTLPWSATLVNGSNSATVQVSSERAWGWDYLWAPVAAINGATVPDVAPSLVVGGGGGFSTVYPAPSYQRGVSGTNVYTGVNYLQPTAVQNVYGLNLPTGWNIDPTGPLVSGTATGRAVPDVSTNADPETGYLVYAPSFTDAGGPALQGGYGGTSFVAPQLNGTAALIDAALGHRVGFWNPLMYRAATKRNSPFTPLQQVGSSNDNVFYTGTPGAVFNPATGLGIPNFAALIRAFGN